jgi:lipopolysaccharide/colanic/teichoic acid biosynthesis glycosyltransferase
VTRNSISDYLIRCVARQMDRLLNTVLAGVLLVFTAPLLIIVAVAIRCETAGPILVNQTWTGRNGRRFQALSFRTTEWDEGRERWGLVTKVGSFVQQTRIEALPQLINVLRGEISLIDMGDS